MNKIIAVTSGKGGTGKSTFSMNLAIAAARDNRVLLIDMDAGMRCLDLLLGVSESVVMDVSDVTAGADIESVAVASPLYSGVWLLPAPQKANIINPDDFAALLETASEKFGLVIVDFPAGSDYTLYEKLPRSCDIVCVCNPDPVSVRDAAVCGQAIRRMGKKGYLVINKYSYKYIQNGRFKNLDDILNEAGLQLLGIVPKRDDFVYSFSTGKFPRHGRGARAFRRIYRRVSGESLPLPKLKKI